MDIVYLHGLRLETVIGVWDWERHIRQTLIVDLDMGADIARAAASDSIDDTIDYKTVADRLVEIAKESSYALVESLAERIAGELTGALGIPWVRVRITKSGALRGAREVGVLIERGTQG
ncbi:MAG: dihydroneopterin aldolase [Gammaproteobacteria bacterium]|jgi:dihydroneopterin aldolase